ncbi:MAG: NAD(P)H-dependent glycerol-3-phosphate dehydrogenase [candidate division WOR-3 bacterium]
MNKVAFVGAGRWALALALRLDEQGTETALWEPVEPHLHRLLATRRHPDLPDTAVIPNHLLVSGDLDQVLTGARFVIFAVPSESLAAVARTCAHGVPATAEVIITVTKGIDPGTHQRLSTILAEILPARPVVVLAGPAIPYDFALGDPTSLVAASEHESAAQTVRDFLTAGNLRVYSSSDVVGVELGAALKNVIALAAGISDGLGLGINAKAALLTRGLAEMTRLGIALNANPLTFAGLAGMGDLVVTAFSERSRNHALGRLIGQGRTLEQARTTLSGVAEGAATCRTALALSRRFHVEMPITEEVCRILYESSSPEHGLKRLLRRTPKKEEN